jgi:hypothetical protein
MTRFTGQSGRKYAMRTLRQASQSRKETGSTLGSSELRLKSGVGDAV